MGILKWEENDDIHSLPQDYADMLGWKELAAKVAKVYQNLPPSEREQVYIHCDNYGEAGALNFYGRHYNLPEAHSLNSSYILWTPTTPSIKQLTGTRHHAVWMPTGRMNAPR